MFDAPASGWRVATRSILPQRFQHNFADRPASLLRERAGETGGLGVADVYLIFQETAPCGAVGTHGLARALRRSGRRRLRVASPSLQRVASSAVIERGYGDRGAASRSAAA